jgi:hypothetical protein
MAWRRCRSSSWSSASGDWSAWTTVRAELPGVPPSNIYGALQAGLSRILLAGRAHTQLVAREQAPRPALRPVRFHHSIPVAGRMHISGCSQAGSGIVKTASKDCKDCASTVLRSDTVLAAFNGLDLSGSQPPLLRPSHKNHERQNSHPLTLLSGFGVVALLSPPERRYRQTALDQHHDL